MNAVLIKLCARYPRQKKSLEYLYQKAKQHKIYQASGEFTEGYTNPDVNFHHSLRNYKHNFPVDSKEYKILKKTDEQLLAETKL